MNNKGFAITSILYGLLIMFLLIVLGTLAVLSNQKKMMEKLIDDTNGARDNVKLPVITLSEEDFTSDKFIPTERAVYIYNNCKLYGEVGRTMEKEEFMHHDDGFGGNGCID